MSWSRSSTVEHLPADPVGEVIAASLAEIFQGASVELVYSPTDAPLPHVADRTTTTSETGAGPDGWEVTCILEVRGRIAALVTPDSTSLLELLRALPGAALRAAAQFRGVRSTAGPLGPPIRRALRDTIVIELVAEYAPSVDAVPAALIAETLEYLIELSGTRVETHELTHGVIITDALSEPPRLRFSYPADLRDAKRAPVLFDGQRSVLVVDSDGHARSELQRHRLDRLAPTPEPRNPPAEFVDNGSLVAEATRRLGGVGFFLRADRTIWVFVDGQPLVLRRGEHWTAFPLELTDFIAKMIHGGRAAPIIVEAAFIVSAQSRGAILAVVENAHVLQRIVSAKDRFDLRNEFDPPAMRAETRLHHLLDAEDLDGQTLARLAALDGATIVDRAGNLLAYGAIVTSSDSQHEGARTSAAKTLSEAADVALKVSEDGDITVFRAGEMTVTLLGTGPDT
ncbi:MAG: hypothetical protein ACXW1M_06820 [Acidimicrobiia bacterium]